MKKRLLILVVVLALTLVVALAACNKEQYTVTFHSDGGGYVAPQTVKAGGKAVQPAAVTKPGYAFVGWYLGEQLFDFNTPITSNVTLKARWQPTDYYTVHFQTNGGTAIADQQVPYGGKITGVETLRFGYTFVGWLNLETSKFFFEENAVNSNMTLQAQWDKTAAFDNVFGVWEDSVANVTLTLYADCAADVKMKVNGKQTTAHCEQALTRGNDQIIVSYTINGQDYTTTFLLGNGQLTANDGPWGGAITLVPNTTAAHTVTYHVDGTHTQVLAAAHGGAFRVLPGSPADGFALDGWYDSEGVMYTEQSVVEHDLEVYANYYMLGITCIENDFVAYSGNATHLVIPKYRNGYAITNVGNGSREVTGISDITSVEIPEGVTSIKYSAFRECALMSVTIPSTVTTIEDRAFLGCNQLAEITFLAQWPCEVGAYAFDKLVGNYAYMSQVLIWVPDGLAYQRYRSDWGFRDYAAHIFPTEYKQTRGYAVKNGILIGYVEDAFEENRLKDVQVPRGVTEIADFAFYNNTFVESVDMPNGFKKIGKYAFYGAYNVARLYMPSSMEEIDDYAFTGFYVGNLITRLYFPEGFKRIGDGAFLTGFNLRIVSLPSTIEYVGYLAFGAASKLERFYFNSATPPEFGVGNSSTNEQISQVFAYVNVGKTIIYVPYGRVSSGANAGKSYADVYKGCEALGNVVDYVRPVPQGEEVGHYGDGELFLDLDGCDKAVLRFASGDVMTGLYEIVGDVINFDFGDNGRFAGTYDERTLTFFYGGDEHVLKEPKYYYDDYNWANFVLYYNGYGEFDMMGYYKTPFHWEIDGDLFLLDIDGNNPQHPEYAGVQRYVGAYDAAKDVFEVSFMLNDYEELMEYTCGRIIKTYATGESERLLGNYVAYMKDYNDNDYKVYELIFHGDGTMDLWLGSAPYYNLTYVIEGNTVIINWNTLICTLSITKDGDLYGELIDNSGLGNMTFVYVDPTTDPTNFG